MHVCIDYEYFQKILNFFFIMVFLNTYKNGYEKDNNFTGKMLMIYIYVTHSLLIVSLGTFREGILYFVSYQIITIMYFWKYVPNYYYKMMNEQWLRSVEHGTVKNLKVID